MAALKGWVIVLEGDGIFVVGPVAGQTYSSAEAAQKDADKLGPEYDHVHVLPITGAMDS